MEIKKNKKLICFIQLGSPKSPKIKDVRSFLKVFLGDERVVDTNPLVFKIVLKLFILPFRPKHSSKLYSRIWDGKSFPLIEITKKFSRQMSKNLLSLSDGQIDSDFCFILSEPKLKDVLIKNQKIIESGEDLKIIFVPLFPQYSESTTASTLDYITHNLKETINIPKFEFINSFHKSKAFIDNSVLSISKQYYKMKETGNVDTLLISFHGIPKRRVIYKNDLYYLHCMETYFLIKNYLENEISEIMTYSFQSRFGQEEWLTPYTEDVVDYEIENNRKNILVYCPSFVADCLESIDEISYELNKYANNSGGAITCAPCLNDNEKWCEDFATYLCANEDQKTDDLEYRISEEEKMSIEEPTMKSKPLGTETKSTLKIVFLTLFLDLVGFSIIFPLFPGLAKYYMNLDSENFFLKGIFDGISYFLGSGGAIGVDNIVLFGGALGAIYSLLQFVAAPLWGGLSDRIGRKPVLLVSVAGLAISYLIWFFSGSFTILIIARLIGGIMGGNISTATAVVADITDESNRSKGMAFIGIAFATGFIIGPAMGGILSMINLLDYYPMLESYGINPYSLPALVACILSVFNLYFIKKNLKESLPEKLRGKAKNMRSSNPFKLFKPLPYKGINSTILGHFFFLAAFSGMEFTLTFLSMERFKFSAMDNAYMFIFIGFILAFVQGGFVRRKAHTIGEKNMALIGLICIIPGMIFIGISSSVFILYLGLFFLAAGSSMVIPCLTSLVSLYTPKEFQGQSIGVFRSLGALARVVGPIVASVIYWRLGSASPYIYGAAFLIIPILFVLALPKVKSRT